MKVAQLIEQLNALDPQARVVIQTPAKSKKGQRWTARTVAVGSDGTVYISGISAEGS